LTLKAFGDHTKALFNPVIRFAYHLKYGIDTIHDNFFIV